MSSLSGIGLSALRAAQAGLTTTAHNIANVNTPGFSRQETVLAANRGEYTGSGYMGQGVDVTSVRRVYSDYLTQALRSSTAASASATSYSAELSQVDSYLTDSSSNLSSASSAFFAATQTVANNPSDSASRQTLLSSARTLAARFNDLGTRLQTQGADLDRQIGDTVANVNTLARQVAVLNRSIADDGHPSDQLPNDLLDQRDALVQQIAGAVGATAIPQSDGSLNVFVGNGQPLVVGGQANQMTAMTDDQDPSKQQLALIVHNAPQRVATTAVGGSLGGLLKFRDDVLGQAANTLGQMSIALGSALNDQNKLGQDLNGNAGGNLFNVGSPEVIASPANSVGSRLAVTYADPSALTSADYRLDYDGTNYTLTNLSDHSARQYATLPQTVDGVSIAVTSPLAAGDRFTIAPTRNGATSFGVAVTDASKIATAAPVALTSGTTNAGSAGMATLAVLPASPLPANLRSPVDVRFHVSGPTTTYDLVDPSTNTVLSSNNAYTDGATISRNGWALNLSGTPADNDKFTVGPNTNGTGDSRNALLLAAVQQKSILPAGSSADVYNGLVGLVGNQASEASSLSTAQSNLLVQAQESRDALSGVNLDEEAVNLQKYQQAYVAASKSISTSLAMFQAVLGLFN